MVEEEGNDILTALIINDEIRALVIPDILELLCRKHYLMLIMLHIQFAVNMGVCRGSNVLIKLHLYAGIMNVDFTDLGAWNIYSAWVKYY